MRLVQLQKRFFVEWRTLIKDKYGAESDILYFETPVVVDNVSNEVIGGANVTS